LFSTALAEGPQTHSLRWTQKEPEILRQGRRVMESAQLAYQTEGADFERSVEADAPTLLARRVIRMAAAGRWPADKDALKFRERLTIRS
jgi:hypothetical protein